MNTKHCMIGLATALALAACTPDQADTEGAAAQAQSADQAMESIAGDTQAANDVPATLPADTTETDAAADPLQQAYDEGKAAAEAELASEQ